MSSHSSSRRSNGRLTVYFASACALTLGVAAGGFLLFNPHPSEVEPERQRAHGEELSEQVRSLNREVALLRARQATTEERVRSPDFGLQDPEEEASDSSTPPGQEGDFTPPPEVTPEEAKARAAMRYEFIDSSFESERRDAAWSATTENEIAGAFQSAALGGAELHSASCGSTMCKIEMSLGSELELDGFQEEFTRVLRESLPRGTMRQIEGEDGTLKLVAYLARPNHQLPHWEPEE